VLHLTHSGVILGLTTAARFAPVLLLSPYAGLLVDRFSKRRVLLITQAGLGLVSMALGILVLSGHAGLGQVVVLALLFGTFTLEPMSALLRQPEPLIQPGDRVIQPGRSRTSYWVNRPGSAPCPSIPAGQ